MLRSLFTGDRQSEDEIRVTLEKNPELAHNCTNTVCQALTTLKKSSSFIQYAVQRFLRATRVVQRFARVHHTRMISAVRRSVEMWIQHEQRGEGSVRLNVTEDIRIKLIKADYAQQRSTYRIQWKLWRKQLLSLETQYALNVHDRRQRGNAGANMSASGSGNSVARDRVGFLQVKLAQHIAKEPHFAYVPDYQQLMKRVKSHLREQVQSKICGIMDGLGIRSEEPQFVESLVDRYESLVHPKAARSGVLASSQAAVGSRRELDKSQKSFKDMPEFMTSCSSMIKSRKIEEREKSGLKQSMKSVKSARSTNSRKSESAFDMTFSLANMVQTTTFFNEDEADNQSVISAFEKAKREQEERAKVEKALDCYTALGLDPQFLRVAESTMMNHIAQDHALEGTTAASMPRHLQALEADFVEHAKEPQFLDAGPLLQDDDGDVRPLVLPPGGKRSVEHPFTPDHEPEPIVVNAEEPKPATILSPRDEFAAFEQKWSPRPPSAKQPQRGGATPRGESRASTDRPRSSQARVSNARTPMRQLFSPTKPNSEVVTPMEKDTWVDQVADPARYPPNIPSPPAPRMEVKSNRSVAIMVDLTHDGNVFPRKAPVRRLPGVNPNELVAGPDGERYPYHRYWSREEALVANNKSGEAPGSPTSSSGKKQLTDAQLICPGALKPKMGGGGTKEASPAALLGLDEDQLRNAQYGFAPATVWTNGKLTVRSATDLMLSGLSQKAIEQFTSVPIKPREIDDGMVPSGPEESAGGALGLGTSYGSLNGYGKQRGGVDEAAIARILRPVDDGPTSMHPVFQPTQKLSGHDRVVGCLCEVTAPAGNTDLYLASGSHDGTLRIWNATENETIKVDYFRDRVSHVLMVGQRVCAASDDRTIRVLRVKDGSNSTVHGQAAAAVIVEQECIFTTKSWTTAMTSIHGFLVTAGYDSHVFVWDLDNHCLKCAWEGHTQAVNTFLPHGDLLLSASDDGTIRVWEITPELEGNIGTTTTTAQLPQRTDENGRLMAFATRFNFNERIYAEHSKAVYDVKWIHHELQLVASASRDGKVRIWDVKSNETSLVIHAECEDLTCLAITDPLLIVVCNRDGSVRLYNHSTGKCVTSVVVSEAITHSVNLSNHRIALAGAAGHVYIASTLTGQILYVCKGHAGGINELLLRGTDRLLSCGDDRAIAVLPVPSGRRRTTHHSAAGSSEASAAAESSAARATSEQTAAQA